MSEGGGGGFGVGREVREVMEAGEGRGGGMGGGFGSPLLLNSHSISV